jgi:CheY-like chemotaxis protein
MPRVLVIDDSATMVQLVTQALQGVGIEAGFATDLSEVDAQLAHPWDLVLVDVNMPEMYGDDVVEFLRVHRQVKAKLYLYSDIAETELQAKATAVGADGYVTKAHGIEGTVALVQAALGAGEAMPRQRVLVVDDSEPVTKLLEAELVARGHEVFTANNTDDATKLILKKKTRPDVVLLDVQMPGVNGEDFCRFIKTNSLFSGIQVILCSGQEESELKRIMQTAGADGYIRKDSLIAKELLDLLA